MGTNLPEMIVDAVRTDAIKRIGIFRAAMAKKTTAWKPENIQQLNKLFDDLEAEARTVRVSFSDNLIVNGRKANGTVQGKHMVIDSKLSPESLRGTMFHELVHLVGGYELAAYTLAGMFAATFSDVETWIQPPERQMDFIKQGVMNDDLGFSWNQELSKAVYRGELLDWPANYQPPQAS